MTKSKFSTKSIFNSKMSLLEEYNVPKNSIVIYGQHACKSALENKNRDKILLLTTQKKSNFCKKLILENKLNIKVIIVQEKTLDIISNNNVHQNIILIAKQLKKIRLIDYIKGNNSENQKIILLDQLSDPQNIGSIIRSAFAFRFNAVGMLKNNSPFETSSLIKASSGEIEKIKILQLGNLVNEIKLLKENGFFVYGLSNQSNIDIKTIELNQKKFALIIGSEGKGLRALTKKKLDEIIYIPINENCNSLNASNAAAIAMFYLGN